MNTRRLAGVAGLATIVVLGTATAQRVVVNPPANATTEGNSRITFPFGGKGAMHYQQICGLSAIPTAAGSMNRVAFRRDNDVIVSSGDYAAWNPDIDLTLSTSPRTPLSISQVFANNLGKDAKLVFSGVLNWPAQIKNPPGPTAFAYTVPFKTPFTYIPSLGDIVLDIMHKSSDNPNTLCFMDADASNAGATSKLLGPGCPTGMNEVVVYDNWGPGALARILLWKAAFAKPTVFSLGISGSNWGPIPLPLDLAIIGAPGCNIYNDNVLWVIGQTTATGSNGRWDVKFEMPNDPLLGGVKLYTQFYVLNDSSASNPANLTVSQGHEITVATPTPGAPPQGEAHDSSLTSLTAILVQQGYGMVVEFGY